MVGAIRELTYCGVGKAPRRRARPCVAAAPNRRVGTGALIRCRRTARHDRTASLWNRRDHAAFCTAAARSTSVGSPSGWSLISATRSGPKAASSAFVRALSAAHRAGGNRAGGAGLRQSGVCRIREQHAGRGIQPAGTGQRQDLVGSLRELALQRGPGGVHAVVQPVEPGGCLREVQRDDQDQRDDQEQPGNVHHSSSRGRARRPTNCPRMSFSTFSPVAVTLS